MEDLEKKDLLKIIEFYKNKTSQLEFEYLILQINKNNELYKANELIKEKTNEFGIEINKIRTHFEGLVEEEKQSKEKEIALILKKQNIKKETKNKNIKNS
jgi:exonuclease I